MRQARHFWLLLALCALSPGCPSTKTKPRPPAPLAPISLSSSPAGATQTSLSWTNDIEPQTQVAIERSTNNVIFAQVTTVAGTATTCQDQGLFPSSTYYYRIRAFNGSSPSPYSNVSSTTTTTPAWLPLAPGAPAPSARVNLGATNAVGSGQMIICAGDDSSFPPGNTETWALTFAGAGSPSWAQIGTGTNPGVRSFPGVAFSSAGKVILFGGLDQSNLSLPVFKNDVWSLDPASPAAWTPVVTAGTPPSPRFGHAVVMSGLKMYVIGGEIDLPPPTNVLNDVWVLDFSSPTPVWTNPVSSSPMAMRAIHSAALDPLNNQIVVFGGVDGFNYRNDTWALNLTGAPSWKLLAFGGVPPSARGNASMVYSSSARAMLLFGGNGAVGSSLNDVWMLPLSGTSTWFPVFVTGSPPGVRGGHGAIFDDAAGKMFLFGGQDFFVGTLYADAWELSF